jgi:Ca-activated chloride channel family protein
MVQFAHLEFIWMFLFVGIFLLLLFVYHRRKRRDLEHFARPQLVVRLMEGNYPVLGKVKSFLFIFSLFFLLLALVGPKVGKKLIEVKRKGVDIVLVLDTSVSMNAEDIKPNRLRRAKYEASRFIDRLKGDRVGLVAFAGISYLQCPLTLDYSAAKLFLDIIDTGIIGTQGTALADAIGTALRTFNSDEKKHKVIIVVSDGEDHEGALDAIIKTAKNDGTVIYCIGVGSLSGAPIPIYDEKGNVSFKRDRGDHVVTSELKEDILRSLAIATGGKYYNMLNESGVFDKIYEEILGMEKKDLRTHEYSDFRERYQIFLVIGIVLLMLELIVPERKHSRVSQ